MTALVQTVELTKRYGDRLGCRNITLEVSQGHIFGLLGPNGAGKSTFVKMIVGLLIPTSGEAFVQGFPCGSIQAKRRIGYLPELFRYPEWLTAEEVLRFHARLARLPSSETAGRISHVLALVGLSSHALARVRHFSKGMQQRLGIANAYLHDPELIVLDEPSSALDPVGRRDVRLLLKRLQEEGKTVFLNTHLLEDVEALCDEAAFLHEGELKAAGTLQELLYPEDMWEFTVGGWEEAFRDELTLLLGAGIRLTPIEERSDGTAILTAPGLNREQIGWINARLIEAGLTLYEVQRRRHGLESWFLGMMREGKGETV
jgi:ABC-2 type transport system ATP-binding protein